MTEIHDWEFSLTKGKAGELRVAAYLESAGYSVTPTGFIPGGDRPITAPDMLVTGHKTNPEKYLVNKTLEIKTDARAADTGNVVIELFSNVASGRLGWALTCEADVIAYLIEATGDCLFVETPKMKAALATWRGRFTAVENSTFWGLSMLVPISSLANLAWHRAVIP